MTDKEQIRLGRTELLELLLCQTRRAERLQTKLETAQAQLRRREIAIGEAGTLAEAALALSGIFAAADAAAAEYLEHVRRLCERQVCGTEGAYAKTEQDNRQHVEPHSDSGAGAGGTAPSDAVRARSSSAL